MIPVSGWNAGLARGQLADDAHRPVLQISKSKTVNYHMQVAGGETGHA